MGRLFIESLPGPRAFKCKSCKVDLASYDEMFSPYSLGRDGLAFLFNTVVNVSHGPDENRQLLRGLYTVNDVYCSSCQQLLGWRYEKSYQENEKYIEGKYSFEIERILREGW